jgi:predicted NBD/HSP70 family sugar kinase
VRNKAAAGSQSSLREANRSLVLQTVRRWGGLTQVELAAATGLSTATVSNIVREMYAAGLVDTAATTRSGRRARLVTLARRLGLAFGVHIGSRHLRIVLGDFAHAIIAEQSLPLPPEHRMDASLDRVALLVADMLDRVGAAVTEVVGIGVGVPAPVDAATGMISVSGVMRGWDNTQLGQTLAKRVGCPVSVDNEANLGALAESTLGASRSYRDSAFVMVSYTTGAGLVIDGKLHRGYAGLAGEIGHIQVDPQGIICSCGNRGCLDTVVGADALLEALRPSHGALSLRDVVQMAKEGDQGCSRLVADAGAQIGAVVASLGMVMNPQIVVVGGELADSGEILLGPMRTAITRRMVVNRIAPVDVVPAVLGPRAEVMGALLLALQAADVPLVIDSIGGAPG